MDTDQYGFMKYKLTPPSSRDYTYRYNTILPSQEEKEFLAWATKNKVLKDLYDYDMRGAFRDGLTPEGNLHWSDKYKKPNHPTFSNQSIYSSKEHPGGSWYNLGNQTVFMPSNGNLYNPNELKQYFKDREPNAILLDSRRF